MSSWQDELRPGESKSSGKDIKVGDVISGNISYSEPFIGRWNMGNVFGYRVKELTIGPNGINSSVLVYEMSDITVNTAYLIDHDREYIVRKPCRRVTVEIASSELLPRDILEQDSDGDVGWKQAVPLAVTSVRLSNDKSIMSFTADHKSVSGSYACMSRYMRRVSREQYGPVSKGEWPHQCTLCGQASYNGIVSVTHREPNPNCTAWRY
jgi:hypothetical protein